MSDTDYTDYLDGGGYAAPASNDVDVFVSATLREQAFGTLICLEYSNPAPSLSIAMAPGELTFIVPAITFQATVKAPLPEILSTTGNFAYWKVDAAGDYPDQTYGVGWYTDNSGFVVPLSFDTYGLSVYL